MERVAKFKSMIGPDMFSAFHWVAMEEDQEMLEKKKIIYQVRGLWMGKRSEVFRDIRRILEREPCW